MLVLSILSLVAYECVFQEGFASTPESYFFHLFYYRSSHCDSFIDWSVFGLENAELLNDFIIMPEQTAIVSRTYKLTIIQIIINSLLILVSLIAIGKFVKMFCLVWGWKRLLVVSWDQFFKKPALDLAIKVQNAIKNLL